MVKHNNPDPDFQAKKELMGHDKPLQIPESDKEKLGAAIGYIRFFKFESGVIVDAAISPSNLVDTISKAMSQDEDLAKALEAAVAMHGLRKSKLGRLISDALFSEDCDCPKCVEKREKEKSEMN